MPRSNIQFSFDIESKPLPYYVFLCRILPKVTEKNSFSSIFCDLLKSFEPDNGDIEDPDEFNRRFRLLLAKFVFGEKIVKMNLKNYEDFFIGEDLMTIVQSMVRWYSFADDDFQKFLPNLIDFYHCNKCRTTKTENPYQFALSASVHSVDVDISPGSEGKVIFIPFVSVERERKFKSSSGCKVCGRNVTSKRKIASLPTDVICMHIETEKNQEGNICIPTGKLEVFGLVEKQQQPSKPWQVYKELTALLYTGPDKGVKAWIKVANELWICVTTKEASLVKVSEDHIILPGKSNILACYQ
jgi:hypothetical protein